MISFLTAILGGGIVVAIFVIFWYLYDFWFKNDKDFLAVDSGCTFSGTDGNGNVYRYNGLKIKTTRKIRNVHIKLFHNNKLDIREYVYPCYNEGEDVFIFGENLCVRESDKGSIEISYLKQLFFMWLPVKLTFAKFYCYNQTLTFSNLRCQWSCFLGSIYILKNKILTRGK